MQKYVIALYIRLSLEDFKTESLSIPHQRMLLRSHAETLPDTADPEILEFIDNGYSGANFERPAMQELLELVRSNRIDCIIVKDFSRFGRNILETGYFIEQVFPLFRTRFISINDDFDTIHYKGDTGGMVSKGAKNPHDVSRTNGVWQGSTVLRILRDERYIGTYIMGKRAVTEVGGKKLRQSGLGLYTICTLAIVRGGK